MEVTSKNFAEAVPMIQASIEKSDFLAIDTEFTGLRTSQKERSSSYDYPEKTYSTILKQSSDFLLIQFGLSAFYWDPEAKTYMNDTYSILLYPHVQAKKFFLCDSESLQILAANGLDLNKLATEGIGYLTETEEKVLRQKLNETIVKYEQPVAPPTLRDGTDKCLITNITHIRKKLQDYFDSNETEPLILDKYNLFVENYVIQDVNSRKVAFAEYVTIKYIQRVKVSKILSHERNEKIKQQIDRERKEFEDVIGFSKVARMIQKSEKLLVGHNLLLDILHTINHCIAPLPNDYSQFKKLVHASFPNIIDTKYLANFSTLQHNVNSASLTTVLASLSEPPFSMPKVGAIKGRGCRLTDDNYHDAGYDAYITGMCFLAMCQHLERSYPDQRVDVMHSYPLAKFRNKLFLSRTAPKDVPCINLTESEKLPSRHCMFYVTFPAKYRKTLYKFFSVYGYVTVEILSEESAIIELSIASNAPLLLKNFKHPEITVMSFEKYTKTK